MKSKNYSIRERLQHIVSKFEDYSEMIGYTSDDISKLSDDEIKDLYADYSDSAEQIFDWYYGNKIVDDIDDVFNDIMGKHTEKLYNNNLKYYSVCLGVDPIEDEIKYNATRFYFLDKAIAYAKEYKEEVDEQYPDCDNKVLVIKQGNEHINTELEI